MNNTNNKTENVSSELKTVKIREVVIQDLLIDVSSPDDVVIRVRVYGNKCDIDRFKKYQLLDVRMSYDKHEDYLEFRKSMTTQHSIRPRVPEADEFEDEPELMNKVWVAFMFNNIGESKEALRIENPTAYEAELPVLFDERVSEMLAERASK